MTNHHQTKIKPFKADKFFNKNNVKVINIEWIEQTSKGLTVYPECEQYEIPTPAYLLSSWASKLQLTAISGLTTTNPTPHQTLIILNKEVKIHRIADRLGIPSEIIKRTNFAGGLQFTLIHWAARDLQARDLLNNNPVLLWMMIKWIGTTEQRMIPSGLIFELIHDRQHNILRNLYGICSRANIKMLRKLHLEKMGDAEYKSLVYFIKHETAGKNIIRSMQHWKKIPSIILEPIHEYFKLAPEISPFIKILNFSPEIIIEQDDFRIKKLHQQKISQSQIILNTYKLLFDWIRDCSRMSLGISLERYQQVAEKLQSIQSFSGIGKIHNELVKEFQNKKKLENSVDTFSQSPPVSGNKNIDPINSISGLIMEGEKMHHCVGSYADYVQSGRCWIYKILRPERATLELLPRNTLSIQEQQLSINKTEKIQRASKHFKIGQLYGLCNQPVSQSTQKAIKKWLQETELK